ncbi:MAG: LPS assembly lipoprotein LptE [Bacteroidaceae bacterium]|jgi:hypothetical protein
MAWIKTILPRWARTAAGVLAVCLLCLTACKISYSFTGASIDYTKVKTISIADFPIRADYVYAPLATVFNTELQDIFARQTRLKFVNKGGDLEIGGEIVAYRQINQSVQADGFASEVRLEIEVNVRFTNNTAHEKDFERRFSAYRTYEASQALIDVQDDLIDEMVGDITEQIFNATVADW